MKLVSSNELSFTVYFKNLDREGVMPKKNTVLKRKLETSTEKCSVSNCSVTAMRL